MKIWLLAGTLGIAITAVSSASAATTSTSTGMTNSVITPRATHSTKVKVKNDPAVVALREQIRQSNQSFRDEQKLLHQQLKAAPRDEKASIRAEIVQLRQQHAAELRDLRQNLKAEIRTARQSHRTA